MALANSSRFDGILCALTAVLAPLIAWPFAEVGFMDDFSYIRTAQLFTQTGHFAYNGWATVMLGWQILWGALFIKLLGPGFTVPRLSTVASTFFLIWIFHSVAVRFGLNRRNATFASLLLGLSPVLMPLTFSFMTDTNGLLVLIVCIYACLHALDARTDGVALAWLALAAISNIVGGTVRQIAWVGVLAVVPAAAWHMRTRRGALALGILLWGIGVGSIIFIGHWFSHMPGAMAEELVPADVFQNMRSKVVCAIGSLLCLALMLLPLLADWFLQIKRFSRTMKAMLVVVALSYAGACLALVHSAKLERVIAPWILHIFGEEASLSNWTWIIVNRSITNLPIPRTLVSVVVVLALLCFLIDLRPSLRMLSKESGRALFSINTGPRSRWPVSITLLVPYLIAYTALLIPRGLHGALLDRYLLGLIPPLSIMILLVHQRLGRRLTYVSYGVLASMACFGVAGTHDLFAMRRAQIRATESLMQSGIPRTKIDGGFEFDAWTQFQQTTYLYDPRVLNVGPSFQRVREAESLPSPCWPFFYAHIPSVQPEYFIATDKTPCVNDWRSQPVDATPSVLGRIEYGGWLPPFRRAIWILQRRRALESVPKNEVQ